MSREDTISELAERIVAIRLDHPVRVAIDGVDASGKTMLADELVEPIQRRGRTAIRVSVDGFHRPKAQRYRRGPDSGEGYYHDTTDYAAVRREVLLPLGPGGNRCYREAIFVFQTDTAVDSPVKVAPPDAILLFEGVFLLRPELIDCWDFRIFVQAGFDVTVARAMSRDLYLFGTAEGTKDRYIKRYVPGQQLYLSSVQPERLADVIVHNDDLPEARLVWRQDCT